MMSQQLHRMYTRLELVDAEMEEASARFAGLKDERDELARQIGLEEARLTKAIRNGGDTEQAESEPKEPRREYLTAEVDEFARALGLSDARELAGIIQSHRRGGAVGAGHEQAAPPSAPTRTQEEIEEDARERSRERSQTVAAGGGRGIVGGFGDETNRPRMQALKKQRDTE